MGLVTILVFNAMYSYEIGKVDWLLLVCSVAATKLMILLIEWWQGPPATYMLVTSSRDSPAKPAYLVRTDLIPPWQRQH